MKKNYQIGIFVRKVLRYAHCAFSNSKIGALIFLMMLLVTGVNVRAQQNVVIGTGTSNSNSSAFDPVQRFYNYTHTQIVYLASELSAAGMTGGSQITAIGFSISEAASSLNNFTISMGQTTQALASPMISAANLTVVKPSFTYNPIVQTAGNFDMITLTNPFVWNGMDNIIINICTGSNPFASPYGGLRYSSSPSGAMTGIQTDGSSNCGTFSGMLTYTYRPNIRMDYIPGAPCTGVPTTGVITSSDSLLYFGQTYTIAAGSGVTIGSGVSYQWQSSPLLQNNWTNITNAISPNLVETMDGTQRYRLIITCTNSNLSDTSNIITVKLKAPDYVPVTLAGYNADVIANGVGSAMNSTNNDVDGVNYDLVAQDFQATPSSSLPTKFVPNNRTFQNNEKWFILNDYSQNNSLRRTSNQSGTLTFLTPKKAKKVYVLGVSGSGISTVSATLNFDDGTTQTVTGLSWPDWFATTGDIVANQVGRVNRNNNSVESGAGPQLVENLINVDAANQQKQIDSITFSVQANSNVMNILAISVIPPDSTSCPTPSGLTANNIQDHVATITWNSNGITGNYEVSYGVSGTTPSNGTIVSVTGDTTQTITGLISDTSYDVFVRSNCGSGDFSDWIGPLTIHTTLPNCTGTPNPGQIDTTSFSICATDAFTLTDTGATNGGGLSYQWQKREANGQWQDITGSNNFTLIFPNGISVNTDFRFYVTCTFSNLSDTSAVVSVTMNPGNQCYCVVTSTNTNYGISNFMTMNGITNINNTSGAGAYTNYSDSLAVSQVPGGQVAFKITRAGSSTEGMGLWIDWNNNGVFTDPGEMIYNSQGYISGPATDTITVPANQPVGDYRMRVVANELSTTPIPCGDLGNQSYGEAEDYTFTVLSSLPCIAPTALNATNITDTSAVLSWTANNTGSTFDIEWGPHGFTQGSGTLISGVNNPDTLNGLSQLTTYDFYVRQNCGSTNGNSYWVGPYSFMTNQTPTTLPYDDDLSVNHFSFVNGTQTNQWFYGAATGNPANAIYISNNNGASNAYTNSSTSVVQAYRDIVVPTGASFAHFSFDWLGLGESGYDYMRVWLVPVSYLPTAGTQISGGSGRIQVLGPNSNNFNQQSTWQTYTDTLFDVSSFAGQIMRLVFEWRNDGSAGSQPPAAVDNIHLALLPPCTGSVAAGTITQGDTLHVCATVPFSIDVTGATTPATGLTYQWQSRQNNGTWSDIAGGNQTTLSFPNGISLPTDYRLYVVCATGNATDTSSPITVLINSPLVCYCTPGGTSSSYYINNFSTTNGVQNISNMASGYSPNGYGVFLNDTVSQVPGQSVNFSANYVASSTFGTKIWVDWNQNGAFESNEIVYQSSSYASNTSGTIAVPQNALIGNTRMRIGISFTPNTGPASPCESGSREFEDYTFVVIGSCPTPIYDSITADNIGSHEATVSWDNGSPIPGNGYDYYVSDVNNAPAANTTPTGNVSDSSVNLTGLNPNTQYYFWLKANCSPTEQSGWTTTGYTFTTTCDTPVLTMVDTIISCAGSSIVLSADTGYSAYLWTPGNATTSSITITASTDEVYHVTVTDQFGCTGSDSVYVSVLPIIAVNLGNDTSLCPGASLTLDAGNSGDAYIWNTGDTTQTIIIDTAGLYSVAVNNTNGCVSHDSIIVTAGVVPTLNLNDTITLCTGGSVTINAANPGSAYLWNTGAITQTVQVDTTGTYSVVVTSPDGCVASDSTYVNEVPLPIVNIGNDTAVCVGSSITLNAGSGWNNYHWTPGNSTNQTISLTVHNNLTYSVKVTDQNGCQNTDTISITANALPIVNLGADTTICPASQIVLDATTSNAVAYNWTTGSTADSITVTGSGTYGVSVTDQNGCVGIDSIVIASGVVPDTLLPPTVDLCVGSTTVLDAGNFGSTYSWNTGATTQSIQVDTSGTYIVTITSGNQCNTTDTVTVTLRPLPVVDLGSDQSICVGSQTTLDAQNPGASYSWNTGETTQMISVSDSGTYIVVVTDSYQCVGRDSVDVALYPVASFDGINFVPLFGDNVGEVEFYPINPQNVAEYHWSFGDGGESSLENPVHTYAGSGDYLITLTVVGEADCDSVTLSQEIHLDISTGIVEIRNPDNSIQLYPNPARERVIIKAESPNGTKMTQVSVFDVLGKRIYEAKVNNQSQIEVPVQDLASGVYSVKILMSDNQIVNKRFEVLK